MTAEIERPFFQNVGTGEGWTKDEREWRIADHVLLNELPASAIVVFVDTEAARNIVQNQTEWQVVVVPDWNQKQAGELDASDIIKEIHNVPL